MSKQIIIIGGGISGLAVLHHLKQKFKDRPDIQILLIEKNPQPGGVIQSYTKAGCLFEAGPEGFLTSKASTLQLAEELGLKDEVIQTPPETKLRYLCINNKLHAMPMGPGEFLRFKPFGIFEKLRVLSELFTPGKSDPKETVYQFGQRRFGKKFTEYFMDAMSTGIYGGNIRQLNLKTAFPQIYSMEEQHGSLLRAGIRQMKTRKKNASNLLSLRHGMGQLINALQNKYHDHISLEDEVYSLVKSEAGYVVETNKRKYFADEIFLCTPAYSAARLLRTINQSLALMLERIEYVPMTIIGLVYRKSSFQNAPRGFGYLVPSREGKKVLGMIFSSNVFPGRADSGKILLRVMLKGDHRSNPTSDAIRCTQDEVAGIFKVTDSPIDTFSADWPAAIPQYTTAYQALIDPIKQELAGLSQFHVVASYWGGVSVNDCTQNAKNAVAELSI